MGNIIEKQSLKNISCLKKELSNNDPFMCSNKDNSNMYDQDEPIVVYFLPNEIYEKNIHFKKKMAIKYNLNSMWKIIFS